VKALVRRSVELVATALMYDTRGLSPRLRKPRLIRTRQPIAQRQRRLHMRDIKSPLYARFEAHWGSREPGTAFAHSTDRVKLAALVKCDYAVHCAAHETRTIPRPNREEHEMTPADA
jgi:hypothetical protein